MEGSQLIDKNWISLSLPDKRFIEGVEKFIEFANNHCRRKEVIPCPCSKCRNGGQPLKHEDVKLHLYQNGFYKNYNIWYLHGEKRQPTDLGVASSSVIQMDYINYGMNMNAAIDTVVGELGGDILDAIVGQGRADYIENEPVVEDQETLKFDTNLREAMSALYPECNDFTVLRFVVKLYKIKVTHGVTDQCFTEILQLLQSAFPRGNKVPENTYRAQKLVKDLELKYEKIDACPNDCTLYWKQDALLDKCPKCNVSRYKIPTVNQRKKKNRPPAKTLRYFPITDRLKRLYSVPWVAKEMCWHSTNQLKDGEMGHPVDSLVWKCIDNKYKDFSAEVRNVRLGLATDGFNPFGTCGTSYSSWPVMCVTYNLPPWLCMKPQFIMLALLVDGPRQPGKNLGIYLRPLLQELNSLWRHGVNVNDAYKGEVFKMRSVLLWTIHDLPAFANVSGCKTSGTYGCPCCGPQTSSFRLHYGKKSSYMDHRRFVPILDKSRVDTSEGTFNKKQEFRDRPTRLSGKEVLEMTKDLKVEWGKGGKKNENDLCFSRRSVFFELDYWKELPIRHNLDVMHIEKNVCEILIALMLNIKGKTKDDVNARKDLKRLGIKKKYWLTDGDSKKLMKPGAFCLRPEEKKMFFQILGNLSVPIGFSSNWKNIVKSGAMELKGLKSHDYHILMQHLLPILVQHAYKDRKEVRYVINSISTFFRALYSSRLHVDTLVTLERGMARTSSELEKICPPSVFVIMMHLPIHLAYEARFCGPVFYRSMWSFERMMKIYKGYVSNKARPEGCIARRYLQEETLNYCTGYEGGGSVLENLEEHDTGSKNLPKVVFDSVDDALQVGPIGVSQSYELVGVEYEQARNWVIKSHPKYLWWNTEYNKFIESCKQQARRKSGIYKVPMNDEFIPWLRRQPQFLDSDDVLFKDIVRGPISSSIRFNKYCVNGFLFATKDYQQDKVNQNSGVSTKCPTTCRSSAKDKNPIDAFVEYYGVLKNIIQLEYRKGYKPVLFKCDWVKPTQHGVKMDVEANLRLVNLSNLLSSEHMGDEPFILAEAATQIFYSKDPLDPEWHVILKVPKKIYSDEDDMCIQSDESVVDSSFARPVSFEPNKEDELIFNEMEESFAVVDDTLKRKRRSAIDIIAGKLLKYKR